jgi:uncharacterized protein YciI
MALALRGEGAAHLRAEQMFGISERMISKYVLLYESADDVIAKVPAHYPAHRARLDEFHASGELLEVGTFGNPQDEGSMAVFASRETAERFARDDPFVLGGVVRSWQVREWQLVDFGAAVEESLARRFVRALATDDQGLLDEIYDADVLLYTPLGWPIRGREAVKEFVGEFHASNPGLRVTLHDEFESADGARACFRFVIHFHNTGPFYGNAPTGERGTMSETHAVRVRDGRIFEQFVGDNNFSMPHQELVAWKMEFPRDTPDPNPVLFEDGA